MAVMNEDFDRCRKCDEGWFEEKSIVVIGKHSDEHQPVVIRRSIQYRCVNCGRLQYSKDETIV